MDYFGPRFLFIHVEACILEYIQISHQWFAWMLDQLSIELTTMHGWTIFLIVLWKL